MAVFRLHSRITQRNRLPITFYMGNHRGELQETNSMRTRLASEPERMVNLEDVVRLRLTGCPRRALRRTGKRKSEMQLLPLFVG